MAPTEMIATGKLLAERWTVEEWNEESDEWDEVWIDNELDFETQQEAMAATAALPHEGQIRRLMVNRTIQTELLRFS